MAHTDQFQRAEALLTKMGELDARIEATRDFIGKAAHPALPYAPSAKGQRPDGQAHANPFKRSDGSVKTQAELDEDQDRAAAKAGLVPKGSPAPVAQEDSQTAPAVDAIPTSAARKKASDLVRKALAAIEAAQEFEDSDSEEDALLRAAGQKAAMIFLTKAVELDPGIFGQSARTVYKAAGGSSFGPSPAKMPEARGSVTAGDLSSGASPHLTKGDDMVEFARDASKIPGAQLLPTGGYMVSPKQAMDAAASQASRTGSKIFNPGPASEKVAEMAQQWGLDKPEIDAMTWKQYGVKAGTADPSTFHKLQAGKP